MTPEEMKTAIQDGLKFKATLSDDEDTLLIIAMNSGNIGLVIGSNNGPESASMAFDKEGATMLRDILNKALEEDGTVAN